MTHLDPSKLDPLEEYPGQPTWNRLTFWPAIGKDTVYMSALAGA